MKFNLFQDESAPAFKAASRVVEPGEAVDLLRRLHANVLRAGKFDILVDVEPNQIEAILLQLEGWLAEPVQLSDNATAYEGVLRHMAATKKR